MSQSPSSSLYGLSIVVSYDERVKILVRPRFYPCLEDLCESFFYLFFFALGLINERSIDAGSAPRLTK